MCRIQFLKPQINNTDIHKLVVTFPFVVTKHSSNAEYDKKGSNKISVSITDFLLKIWKCKDDIEVEKILFKFALDKINSKNFEELLSEKYIIPLYAKNGKNEKPFDPDKIPNPNGYIIQIYDNNNQKNKIGF